MNLTDAEIDLLHDLTLKALREDMLPACTRDDDCVSCNLLEKVYQRWAQSERFKGETQ